MKRAAFMALLAAAAIGSGAATVRTASEPWVSNRIERAVAPLATTNQLAQAVAPKADAVKDVTISIGGSSSTNLTVRPVYSNAQLVIRECETAGGGRQFRIIRKEMP